MVSSLGRRPRGSARSRRPLHCYRGLRTGESGSGWQATDLPYALLFVRASDGIHDARQGVPRIEIVDVLRIAAAARLAAPATRSAPEAGLVQISVVEGLVVRSL